VRSCMYCEPSSTVWGLSLLNIVIPSLFVMSIPLNARKKGEILQRDLGLIGSSTLSHRLSWWLALAINRHDG